MGDSQRTIQAILQAAERLIIQKGVERTTLEEVAREAGISKGGLLHHFPSKEAILNGIVQNLIAEFEATIESYRVKDPNPRGAFTRAFLQAVIHPLGHCVDVFLALIAAFRETPTLRTLKAQSQARWQMQIESDGIDPVQASIVRLAADGLWLARLHGLQIPSDEIRPELVESLLDMTRQ